MRVLLLFTSGEIGGAERSLSRMVYNYRGSTIEYVVSTMGGGGPWQSWARDLKLNPILFGESTCNRHPGRISLRSVIRLFNYVRKNDIKVIYVIGFRASLVVRLLKLLWSGVLVVHGVRWNPNSASNLDRFFRVVELLTNNLVDFYITNSSIAADTLIRRCRVSKNKIEVIYNGLGYIPEKMVPLNDRLLEVLTVANFNPRKGHIKYLAIISKVLEFVPDAKFLFVGRDDMKGAVQEEIRRVGLSHAVSCKGFNDDVAQFYARARIFVLPSLWGEGCPTSILESMSWGVPAVAYGIDGVPELIINAVDGYLIPCYNEDIFSQKIIALLKDDVLAKSFSKQARQKVVSNFTMLHCSVRHHKVFEGLVS